MYDGLGLHEVVDEDADDDLMYDESEIVNHFTEFYNDVLPEMRRFGEIIQFKVCRNYAAHLRGNVYIQYKDVESGEHTHFCILILLAVQCFKTMAGRYYASKKLLPEFVYIEKWKTAVCGQYYNNSCPR